MNRKQLIFLLVFLAAIVTVYGLVTGKFLFLFIWLPLGFMFRKKPKEDK